MLPERDKLHGGVLLRFIKEDIACSIEEVKGDPGHYLLNASTHVFVKHARSESHRWRFSFSPDVIETVTSTQDASGLFGSVHLLLICDDEVCQLSVDDWSQVLALGDARSHQTLRVERPAGRSFRVQGSKSKTARTVPLSRFPSLAS